MFEIIDDNGTIHSGCEDEMRTAFDIMKNPENHSKQEAFEWGCKWFGDLKLIQIHEVTR